MRVFIKRAAFYLFTAWAAITINFFIPRMMKGDPVSAFIAKSHGELPPEAADSIRILFGLDENKSMLQQYWEYWGLIFKGDLGRSFSNGLAPVSQVIFGALPWTVGLVGTITVIAFALGTMIGAIIGWNRGSKSELIVPVAQFISTVPYFWLGLIAIALFSSGLGWFPASHAYSKGAVPNFSWEFAWDVIVHAALPALTVVIASLGGWILGMRNMMVTVLDEDYITVAEAKGLKPKRVLWAYAARNAVLPQFSSFALSLGFIVSGTLIVELVFSYPGVGKMLLDATNAKDYPLMQGIFLVITMAVLLANIFADAVYVWLDPRARSLEA